jgi:kynurenine formamidase
MAHSNDQEPGVLSRIISFIIVIAALAFVFLALQKEGARDPTLLEAFQTLKAQRFVDLTHPFEPGIPHWPDFPDEERQTLYSHEEGEGTAGTGFYAQQYSLVGQWGTHVDAPAHFVKGGRTVDQIRVEEMFLRLVVIDVHDRVSRNPDYTVTMRDVVNWERTHGPIPSDAFVVLRTDWSKRWPDVDAMRNEDDEGVAHYPGWSQAVLQHLCDVRGVAAIGHETTDTDPGVATSAGDYSLETYVLSRDKYQIEHLTNVDQLPEWGAVAVVTFPKPKDGSGFPARVFAIVP